MLARNTHRSITARSLTAASLLMAVAASASLAAQDPQKNDPSRDRPDVSYSQQGMQGQELQTVQRALSNLNHAALRVLESKANSWKTGAKGPGGMPAGVDRDAYRPRGDKPEPASDTIAARASTGHEKLNQHELLVAASPSGTLIGAPCSTEASGTDPQRGTDDRADDARDVADGDKAVGSDHQADATAERDRQSASSQLAGMILICPPSNEHGAEEGAAEASAPRGAEARMRAQALQPGVYAVKVMGDAVTLENEAGQVVLRSTIDTNESGGRRTRGGQVGRRGADRASGDGDRSRRDRGQSDSSADDARGSAEDIARSSSSEQHSWEVVFGAITKEVMTAAAGDQKGPSSARSGR